MQYLRRITQQFILHEELIFKYVTQDRPRKGLLQQCQDLIEYPSTYRPLCVAQQIFILDSFRNFCHEMYEYIRIESFSLWHCGLLLFNLHVFSIQSLYRRHITML
ncbi:hypothetical protein HHI36_008348 [Cryptolaemus montrouzieri]|uniref:Uncharacterized protein n=1 Tax=Cryptolaemus montrouzieri TaxID=559131 RepID=A0ABD2MSQ8_9CUCU